MSDAPKFIAITATASEIIALDADGRVWRYIPAQEKRFAFWTKLTDHRADPAEGKGR